MSMDKPRTSAKLIVDLAIDPHDTIRDAAWDRIAKSVHPVFVIAGVTTEVADELVAHVDARLAQEGIPLEWEEALDWESPPELSGRAVKLDSEVPAGAIRSLVRTLRHARQDAHCAIVVVPGERDASLMWRELSTFLVEGNFVVFDPSMKA